MELVLVDTRSGRRRTIALGDHPIVLGSGVDCDVVVPDADVAENACRASVGRDGIVLEALGATAFTLNERRATAAILHPGDVVRLGPFQLVAAGRARVEAPGGTRDLALSEPAAAPPREPTAEELAARDAREEEFVARRRRRHRNEAAVGALVVVAILVGALAWWRHGDFPGRGRVESGSREGVQAPGSEAGGTSAQSPGASPITPHDGGASSAPEPAEVGRGWREPTPPEEVAATLAKVDKLLELDEFARCRWLLWRITPSTDEDRARVERRRVEVDAAAKRGGEQHLAFVDELVKKGRLPAALGHCEEESIERFRGLAAWYRLLERGDEIEALLNERVPESLRPKSSRRRARPMPPDLEQRPPPPAKLSLAEEMGAADAPSAATARRRETAPQPQPQPEPPAAPPPPSEAEVAAQESVAAALRELAAARPAAFEAAARKATEAVHAAREMAASPLLARCEELADALERAPERAPLDELRRRVQALAAARAAALAFIFDEKLYPMLDPKAPGDVNRGGELAKLQKEADRLVDAVRGLWGSEQGGAPAPQVSLSEDYLRLVQEARLIDGLLAALGRPPPDRAELLGTRLLAPWAPKVTVRNYALDAEERRRIDSDHEIKGRNQQLKEVKDADALELLSLTNQYREMLGRPQLAFDRALHAEARAYAELTAPQSRGARESDPQPDPTRHVAGTEPAAGANYLRGRHSPRQALQAWFRIAAAHRNLLDAEHRAMASASVGQFRVQRFGLLAPPR